MKTFHVASMCCPECAKKAQKALMRLKGVEMVNPDVPRGEIQVSYDPKEVGGEELKNAIENAGFACSMR
jgi:copper chaperone CopZ